MKQKLVFAPDLDDNGKRIRALYLRNVEVFEYNHIYGYVTLGRKKHEYRPESFDMSDIIIEVE